MTKAEKSANHKVLLAITSITLVLVAILFWTVAKPLMALSVSSEETADRYRIGTAAYNKWIDEEFEGVGEIPIAIVNHGWGKNRAFSPTYEKVTSATLIPYSSGENHTTWVARVNIEKGQYPGVDLRVYLVGVYDYPNMNTTYMRLVLGYQDLSTIHGDNWVYVRATIARHHLPALTGIEIELDQLD